MLPMFVKPSKILRIIVSHFVGNSSRFPKIFWGVIGDHEVSSYNHLQCADLLFALFNTIRRICPPHKRVYFPCFTPSSPYNLKIPLYMLITPHAMRCCFVSNWVVSIHICHISSTFYTKMLHRTSRLGSFLKPGKFLRLIVSHFVGNSSCFLWNLLSYNDGALWGWYALYILFNTSLYRVFVYPL